MRIAGVFSKAARIPIRRPYAVAFDDDIDEAALVFVRVHTEDGPVGWGAASPCAVVTGEDPDACADALRPDALSWLGGRDVRHLPALGREVARRLPEHPAARAALDMALHDLWAQALGLPLVEALGRCHHTLETSVTVGIRDSEATVAEAEEHVGHGFSVLKLKVGGDVDEDLDRVRRVRERVGRDIRIRVDANMAWTPDQTTRFMAGMSASDVEFLEQPLPRDALDAVRSLPPAARERLCLDESVTGLPSALDAVHPPAARIVNLKLMKTGGIAEARRIADVAEVAGCDLMWGCMDESRLSIAAALHAALACPATRYLDLDGHLDLAQDPMQGGFVLEDGCLRPLDDRPGLGVVGNPDVL